MRLGLAPGSCTFLMVTWTQQAASLLIILNTPLSPFTPRFLFHFPLLPFILIKSDPSGLPK